MDVFVQHYQPDKYEKWLEGADVGPDPKDPRVVGPAPSPYDLEYKDLDKWYLFFITCNLFIVSFILSVKLKVLSVKRQIQKRITIHF